jgi:hypothetical protein
LPEVHILAIKERPTVWGVDFWIFGVFNFLQMNLDLQKNSKTKEEKAFFFIFMSSYAEMSF